MTSDAMTSDAMASDAMRRGPAAILLRQLDNAGYRLTEPRRAILTIIAGGHERFTSAELLDSVQREASSIGRATVFRTLDLLTAVGILQRVHLDDAGCHSYVVCGRAHHHHIVCANCNRVMDFEQGEVEALLARLGERHGFKVEGHHLEVYGRCQDCQAATHN